MKKSTLIIGPAGSGKALKVIELEKNYDPDRIRTFRGNEYLMFSRFAFQSCEKDTELIVIEEVSGTFSLDEIEAAIALGIRVEKRGELPFIINPDFIIVCDSEIKGEQLSNSFLRRVEIIDCSHSEN